MQGLAKSSVDGASVGSCHGMVGWSTEGLGHRKWRGPPRRLLERDTSLVPAFNVRCSSRLRTSLALDSVPQVARISLLRVPDRRQRLMTTLSICRAYECTLHDMNGR